MWRWWAGFLLVFLGSLLDLTSYGMAPSSIVTPVGSLTLVVNIFLAHWWLGESIYRQDYAGTVLIVAGATMTVVFGNQSETCLPVAELARRYGTWSMGAYIGGVVVVIAAMYLVQRHAEKLLKRSVTDYRTEQAEAEGALEVEVGAAEGGGRTPSVAAPSAAAPGAGAGGSGGEAQSKQGPPVAAGSSSPGAAAPAPAGKGGASKPGQSVAVPSDGASSVRRTPSAYESWAQWHPVAVAVVAGTLGAQTVLFAKSFAETIKVTLAGNSQLGEPYPYVFLVALVAFIAAQQSWLAHALQYFDAAFVVPVFQGTFITVSVLGGVAYWQELDGLGTLNLIMFPVAVLVRLAPPAAEATAPTAAEPSAHSRRCFAFRSVPPTAPPPADPSPSPRPRRWCCSACTCSRPARWGACGRSCSRMPTRISRRRARRGGGGSPPEPTQQSPRPRPLRRARPARGGEWCGGERRRRPRCRRRAGAPRWTPRRREARPRRALPRRRPRPPRQRRRLRLAPRGS